MICGAGDEPEGFAGRVPSLELQAKHRPRFARDREEREVTFIEYEVTPPDLRPELARFALLRCSDRSAALPDAIEGEVVW